MMRSAGWTLLPKCPNCGYGNWPRMASDSSVRQCRSCGARIKEDGRRRYFATLMFLLSVFAVPIVLVQYVQSPLLIAVCIIVGGYLYLRITKFVCV